MLLDRNFKLCTTSFIVPDHIIPNVKKLGPYFDEIELLVFESQPASVIPTKQDVQTLVQLAGEHELTYNVHLPVDISLSQGTLEGKKKAVHTLLNVLDRLAPLNATTHTLHLDLPKDILPEDIQLDSLKTSQLSSWKKQLGKTLDDFLSQLEDPSIISIETLDYPFSIIEDIVLEKKIPVCLDMGHAIMHGYDWMDIVQTHKDRLPLVHLHGVDFSTMPVKDHVSLNRLGEQILAQVLSFLKSYTGVVSLEVFNLKNLTRSLAILAKYFTNIPKLKME